MEGRPRPSQPQVVRLSPLLYAYSREDSSTSYDALYWKSHEVNMFLARMDGLGLTMTVLQMAALLVLPILKGSNLSMTPAGQAIAIALLILGALQLTLLRKHLHTYCCYRHHMTVANRLFRAVASACLARMRNYDVMSKWVQPKSRATGFGLGTYCLFAALAQLQASCIFNLPTAVNLLVQPIGAAVVLGWVWNSPPAMHKLPGMRELAQSTCSVFRGSFELLLYFAIDLGLMPGVPAAGLNAYGLPDRCDSTLVYAQLLVYGNVIVACMLPIYACYVIELHHKLSFWRSRDVKVVADRSLFLPFPESPMMSHVMVAVLSPMLLWFVAEQAAPYLVAV